MDNSQIWPYKIGQKYNLLQFLSNFVKIITLYELCVICNKNIQY